MDGIEKGGYRSIPVGSLAFSSDGRSFAYIASDGENDFVVMNGTKGEPAGLIVGGRVTFSPDGRHGPMSWPRARAVGGSGRRCGQTL